MSQSTIGIDTTHQKRIMKVQREFSPDIAQALETIATEKLIEFLGMQQKNKQVSSSEPSKWAKIVARNKKNPINLGDYTEEDRQHRKDFREGFEFQHDKE